MPSSIRVDILRDSNSTLTKGVEFAESSFSVKLTATVVDFIDVPLKKLRALITISDGDTVFIGNGTVPSLPTGTALEAIPAQRIVRSGEIISVIEGGILGLISDTDAFVNVEFYLS